MRTSRRILIIILTACLLCSIFSVCSFAATIDAYPTKDPDTAIVAAVINREIDRIYDMPGAQSELYFEYSDRSFSSLNFFAEYMQPTVNQLNALFASKMVGEDYITVRCSFHSRSNSNGKRYYLGITISVHPDEVLRKRMDDIVALASDMTPREQVDFLFYYLQHNISYREETKNYSGTYTALVYGTGVCMGYTRSMTELCRRLGILCFNLVNSDHMWNCVYLNGKWWMIDVTQNIYLTDFIRGTGNHDFDENIYLWARQYFASEVKWRGLSKAAYMTDLKDCWYTDAVIDCLGRELYNGTSPYTFAPNDTMTRGMFITVLGRMSGIAQTGTKTKFTDVSPNKYYASYIAWGTKVGIVDGIGHHKFAPDDSITREQICKMMVGYCTAMEIALEMNYDSSDFADQKEISPWARPYVKICRATGLVNGVGQNRFDPKSDASRAQVAMILYNFSQQY